MQGRYWLLTIPVHGFTPFLPHGVAYIRGQLECGGESGYLHWQLLVYFSKPVRLRSVRSTFGDWHAELSRSDAASQYVWKEDTAVSNTRFELGKKPFKRNSTADWDSIRQLAQSGDLSAIPADIYVRYYSSLKRIRTDHLQPVGMDRVVHVFWGVSGSGKSRMAWEQAGESAYAKDPLSKFWDGYNNQERVVIDEFRGVINISHVLRWFDRYPCIVEIKGSSTPLVAKEFWITSNLHPRDWYPDLDQATMDALLRRLRITHFSLPFGQ